MERVGDGVRWGCRMDGWIVMEARGETTYDYPDNILLRGRETRYGYPAAESRV